MNQLLKAYALFEKDVDYVVMDNKVKIVDEQTGRIMEGRRYSDGLHQAIEAKESVKVEAATQTYATVTLQNYFRMYHKLAGMTGTAETEAGELWDIYKLDVMSIPTNRPIARNDEADLSSRRSERNTTPSSMMSSSSAMLAGPCLWALRQWRSANSSAVCLTSATSSTKCSMPSATSRRPRWLRRLGNRVR